MTQCFKKNFNICEGKKPFHPQSENQSENEIFKGFLEET